MGRPTSQDTKSNPLAFSLDLATGVPAYRQVINQILGAVASGAITGGDQLPTVRQLAVDLSINPNTVIRAYRELEIRGVLSTQQGIGTFITIEPVKRDEAMHQRQIDQLASDVMARAGASGVTGQELIARLREFIADQKRGS